MDNALKNFNFAKTLEPKNEFIDMKVKKLLINRFNKLINLNNKINL
jgi:hypothetical protein